MATVKETPFPPIPAPADPQPVLGALDAVARGVLGGGYVPEAASRMRERIDLFPPPDRTRFLGVVRALGTRTGALALTGRPSRVSTLAPQQAEAIVDGLLSSRIPARAQVGKVLAALAVGAVYGYETSEFERIGYPGPLGPAPDEPRRLAPLEITEDTSLTCDVVVVGSGAGGGCVAAGLASRGFDVVILEKGAYRAERDFHHREPDSLAELYLYGATLFTSDLGVVIIGGSTLGGGTVVNYTTSFRTPDYVLREWAAETGIEAFVSGEFDASLDEVEQRVGVNTDSSAPGMRDRLMEEGLQKLNWNVGVIPRAVRGCTQDEACGYCGFGCRVGAKQSTMRTYLEDAAAAGARMVVGADVRRVFVEDGRAVGVGALAGAHRLVVRARAVVSAAGAIETPALLLRSGLRGAVGRDLHLHPGHGVFARFPHDVGVWGGTLQARYGDEFRGWDGGYGPIFETIPVHPGLGSSALPWTSAREHRALMETFGRLSLCAVLPRDRTSGRITLSRDGTPRVRYRLTKDDERRIVEGLVRAGNVLEAAGAEEIFTLHRPPLAFRPGGHLRWADDVRRTGVRGKTTGFSFHQMGGARMGTDPSRFVVGPDNESHEVANLFVADASCFPTASGVNPMLTIYGIANRAAGRIAARLA